MCRTRTVPSAATTVLQRQCCNDSIQPQCVCNQPHRTRATERKAHHVTNVLFHFHRHSGRSPINIAADMQLQRLLLARLVRSKRARLARRARRGRRRSLRAEGTSRAQHRRRRRGAEAALGARVARLLAGARHKRPRRALGRIAHARLVALGSNRAERLDRVLSTRAIEGRLALDWGRRLGRALGAAGAISRHTYACAAGRASGARYRLRGRVVGRPLAVRPRRTHHRRTKLLDRVGAVEAAIAIPGIDNGEGSASEEEQSRVERRHGLVC